MDIKDTVKKLPDSPGVYIMKGLRGKTIYVGKANSLKKRVSSYFTKGHLAPRTGMLVSKIKRIDHIKTNSEAEALILEASLIKALRPKFNVEFKDDKTYPHLKLTLQEEFPRLLITRKVLADGARYYGPYTDVKLLRQAVSFMKRLFPLRTCKSPGKRLCMSYHIKKCPGPCAGRITRKAYKRTVSGMMLFLEGKRGRLIRELSRGMEKASARLNFEEAARIRNVIKALGTVVTKRHVPGPMDQIEELKFVLGLRRKPKRIEVFDISNIHGKEAVGSMVSFYDGRPDKKNYRKFRIKTFEGIDDYRMMREIIHRRYRRLIDEKKGLPDLIIIDGGKGHLSSGLSELHRLKIRHIPAIGIAKEFEHIYMPGKRLPIILPGDSSVLQLIRKMRDEAHRFAIAYHVHLRRKKLLGKR